MEKSSPSMYRDVHDLLYLHWQYRITVKMSMISRRNIIFTFYVEFYFALLGSNF